MAKGYGCPGCEQQKGKYENGHYQCSDCRTIWWTPFDRPSAGEKGKGEKCPHCRKQTVHAVADIADVKVYRCSICATSIIVHPK